MTDAIVFTAEPADRGSAARWVSRRLAEAGLSGHRSAAAAARLDRVWADLLPLVFPRRQAGQMVMLALRTGPGALSLEVVGERRGRLPADAAARAADLGAVAEPVGGIEGLTRMRFPV